MKRVCTIVIRCCYECPNYSKSNIDGKDICNYKYRTIIVRPDKEGYLIDKDCPLKEDI
jgi:hypothetical protein